ncbi:MAG: hypothetical protein J5777_02335 [Clostridiales bacterium]|nr:hypothetical protein [Clostridiales bacterium]
MKKLLASILSMAIVMSLSACNGKQQVPAATDSTGTNIKASETIEASQVVIPTEPSATQSTAYNPASEYVKDECQYIKFFDESYDADEESILEYHRPVIQIKSAYADSANKEMAKAVDSYIKNLKTQDDDMYFGTAYIPYLTKDGILSLVFISYGEYELNEYKVYNIDTKTGEKVENSRIAQIAGVSSIRKSAMDALQNWYNEKGWYKIKNYKVVRKNGEKYTSEMKDIEKMFSEKYLNDNMQIGLTNEGKMFFVSLVDTTGGAEYFNWVYDINGNDLDDEDNPFYVGERNPEEDEDEEDDDYDDAFPGPEDGDEDFDDEDEDED